MSRVHLVAEGLTRSIIGAFYEVFNILGFGFLEHVYKAALEKELIKRGHRVEREARVVVYYKGEPIAVQIVDMIVDSRVVVEVKSALELRAGARQQLHNYLRATDLEVGLLLHFGLEPKFYRIVELETEDKTRKTRSTDSTDCTDATDENAKVPPRALLTAGDSADKCGPGQLGEVS